MRPSPESDPHADLNKAFVPPLGWMPPTAFPPTPFLNPGNVVQHKKAADDYLARVAKKISQYRYYGSRNYGGKMFTTRVIARNGRLVTADIPIPSENASLDAEAMETIRLASPCDPPPDKIEGEQATFILPCQYVIRATHWAFDARPSSGPRERKRGMAPAACEGLPSARPPWQHFPMNRFLALCSLALLAGVAACDKAQDTPAKGASIALPDAAKSDAIDPDAVDPDRARNRRPPPATIGGYSNDPGNPNGMPGPSSSVGTSPNRY